MQVHDARYKGEYELPRDPSNDYKTSSHFMERLKYRTDPKPKKKYVFETMEKGLVKTTHISDRFIFEHKIDDTVWWIIVEVNEQAFDRDNKWHTLVSIYAPHEHDDKHKTVFEVNIE